MRIARAAPDGWIALPAALILLAAFFVASYHLQRESLWYDEGWSLWAVHDGQEPPLSLREAAQYVWGSLTGTLARVRGDVHPPLYFLMLDAWTMLTGESVYAVRLFSTLAGLMALAATYAVGARLFDRRAGLMAMVVLGTASFFVYYTREARMYTLLVAIGALSTWAYLRWSRQQNWRRAGVYGVSMALLMYTHYAGALVIAAQTLHLALTRRRKLRLWHSVPLLLAVILFAPWIPVLLTQVRVNNGRPMANSLPTDWGLVAALLLILTSGHWEQYLLPFVLGRALPEIRRNGYAIMLLLLWLLVTPVVLVALNAWVTPIFQIRYNIAVLPAGALLVVYGLRWVGLPQCLIGARYAQLLKIGLAVFLLAWLAYTQLAMYTEFWPDKPRWADAARMMVATRQPLEPAITDINPQSVLAYYDRQFGIRRDISLDVSWRDHTPEEMRDLVAKLEGAPSVWVVMRSDVPSTWDAVSALDGGHSIGYRDSVMNMIFYRFDAGDTTGDNLQFRFGQTLRYEGGIGHQFYARAGESFCLPTAVRLTALQPLDGSTAVGLSLTQGYNTLRARWDSSLGVHEAGEVMTLSPCLDVPVDQPPGAHHLRLVAYRADDSNRLPLIEGPDGSNLYWGTELVLATVSVSGAAETQ